MNDRILIGVGVTLLSLLGLWRERRILTGTGYGRRLVAWSGEAAAPWVLRGLLAAAAAFGGLLAAGVVRPVEW